MFGSDAIKNSLELLAMHQSKARREAEALMSSRETVSATNYFSEVAEKQTKRLRENQERRVEKEKDRRLTEMDNVARRSDLNKERYCRFVDL